MSGRVVRYAADVSLVIPAILLTQLQDRLPRNAPRLVPLALHAGLTTEEQLRVFEPAEKGSRKLIISTNIAEVMYEAFPFGLLLTPDCVGKCHYRGDQVRCGLRFRESSWCSKHVIVFASQSSAQIRVYNPTSALASLVTVPTSIASATQRAGRAGRTSPGVCYRLYPESAINSMPLATPPEITRTDMTTPILQLKSLGIDDLMKFEWVSPPPAETVLRALEGLHAAGMIDDSGRLTRMGEEVVECPVEVGIARMVICCLKLQR